MTTLSAAMYLSGLNAHDFEKEYQDCFVDASKYLEIKTPKDIKRFQRSKMFLKAGSPRTLLSKPVGTLTADVLENKAIFDYLRSLKTHEDLHNAFSFLKVIEDIEKRYYAREVELNAKAAELKAKEKEEVMAKEEELKTKGELNSIEEELKSKKEEELKAKEDELLGVKESKNNTKEISERKVLYQGRNILNLLENIRSGWKPLCASVNDNKEKQIQENEVTTDTCSIKPIRKMLKYSEENCNNLESIYCMTSIF